LITSATAAALIVTGAADAEEWSFLGARYQAMGGAGVAVVDDGHAAYWNPGALAFGQSYDVAIPFGVSAAAEGGILEDIDGVAEFIEDENVSAIIEKIEDGLPLTAPELRDALNLAIDKLPLLDAERQGFVGSAETGLLIRVKRVAVTGIGLGHAGVNPLFDLDNLSFNTSGSASQQIQNLVGNGNDRSGQLSSDGFALSQDVRTIFERFVTPNTGNENFQAQELIWQAEQAGLDTSDPRVQQLTRKIAKATAKVGTGDLASNNSGAFAQGLATQEVGISYGHPFFDKIGIGGNIKYMHGITYFNFIRYDDVDNTDDVLDEITNSENLTHSDSWGIDLGVLATPVDWVRLGVVGRNLNSPSFDIDVPPALRGNKSSAGKSFTLDPQVRAGVAVNVLPIWIVASDIDLTENETENLEGYRSRLLSFGTEFQLPVWKLGLALRGGTYLNVAPGQTHDPVITAGLGLKFWHLQLDLAGGVSTSRERIEASGRNDKFPTRANASVALRWSQSF
jgi:hypothetical protein